MARAPGGVFQWNTDREYSLSTRSFTIWHHTPTSLQHSHDISYTSARHNVFYLSVRSSIRPSVRLLPNLWTQYFELISIQIDTSGPRSKPWNGRLWVNKSKGEVMWSWRSIWRPCGGISRSGGHAEALVSTSVSWVAFLVFKYLQFGGAAWK